MLTGTPSYTLFYTLPFYLAVKGTAQNSSLKPPLSTQSPVIPSYQGDYIIFHNENFLQLQGIVLPHSPFCWTKARAHTTYSIVVGSCNFQFPTKLLHSLQSLGQPLGLKTCRHTVEVQEKRVQLPTTKERGEPSWDRRALWKSTNSCSPSKVAKEWRSIPLLLSSEKKLRIFF